MSSTITHSQEFYEKKRLCLEKPTKICIKCKIEKDKSKFTTTRRHKDGKSPICYECASAIQKQRYEKNPSGYKKSVSKWTKNNLDKKKAHAILNKAVKTGKIIRPKHCQNCGNEAKRIEAHHWKGYSLENVLDVQWLCKPCHKKADKIGLGV